jgi:poly-gamma-glutamate synthesis protein (capsule biosynthesis protein)
MNRREFLTYSAASMAIARSRRAYSQAKPSMRLALAGDVILSRRVSMLTDPRFLQIVTLLREADCAFGNAELVMAHRDEGHPSAAGRSLSVVVEPYVADELRWLGFDMMSTANNHSLDYGRGGVMATLAHLDRAGIVAAGTGANLQEAAAVRYADTPSGRVGLVACASTFAPHAPAVRARGDYPGVAGLNPVRRQVRWQLPRELYDGVRAAAQALQPVQVSGALFKPPPGLTLMGASFVEGPSPDLLSEPHSNDLTRIVDAVNVGRRNARVVLVSLQAHEIYRELTTPDPFVPVLARAAIDAGADVFITHGSHYLAGIEMYRGRPIFYGLGDFFFQYETVTGFAADVYEAYGLAPHALDPSEATERIPLAGGRKAWETVVPTLDYDGDRLLSIELHPVTLGMSLPHHERGTPVAASVEDGERIVTELATLSGTYGCSVRWDGSKGIVDLA